MFNLKNRNRKYSFSFRKLASGALVSVAISSFFLMNNGQKAKADIQDAASQQTVANGATTTENKDTQQQSSSDKQQEPEAKNVDIKLTNPNNSDKEFTKSDGNSVDSQETYINKRDLSDFGIKGSFTIDKNDLKKDNRVKIMTIKQDSTVSNSDKKFYTNLLFYKSGANDRQDLYEDGIDEAGNIKLTMDSKGESIGYLSSGFTTIGDGQQTDATLYFTLNKDLSQNGDMNFYIALSRFGTLGWHNNQRALVKTQNEANEKIVSTNTYTLEENGSGNGTSYALQTEIDTHGKSAQISEDYDGDIQSFKVWSNDDRTYSYTVWEKGDKTAALNDSQVTVINISRPDGKTNPIKFVQDDSFVAEIPLYDAKGNYKGNTLEFSVSSNKYKNFAKGAGKDASLSKMVEQNYHGILYSEQSDGSINLVLRFNKSDFEIPDSYRDSLSEDNIENNPIAQELFSAFPQVFSLDNATADQEMYQTLLHLAQNNWLPSMVQPHIGLKVRNTNMYSTTTIYDANGEEVAQIKEDDAKSEGSAKQNTDKKDSIPWTDLTPAKKTEDTDKKSSIPWTDLTPAKKAEDKNKEQKSIPWTDLTPAAKPNHTNKPNEDKPDDSSTHEGVIVPASENKTDSTTIVDNKKATKETTHTYFYPALAKKAQDIINTGKTEVTAQSKKKSNTVHTKLVNRRKTDKLVLVSNTNKHSRKIVLKKVALKNNATINSQNDDKQEVLPATGENSSVIFSVIGMLIASIGTLFLSRKEHKD